MKDSLDGKLLLVGSEHRNREQPGYTGSSTGINQCACRSRNYTFFDARYRPDLFGHWRSTVVERVLPLASRMSETSTIEEMDELTIRLDHAKIMIELKRYLDFFCSRINAEHAGLWEITPSCATLTIHGFQAIRDTRDAVRILFIMRDPVAGLISGVRHERRMVGEIATREDTLLGIKNPTHMARCRYNLTLRTSDRVFGEKDVLVDFYETLFTESSLARLAAFVGLDGLVVQSDERVSASAEASVLNSDERLALRHLLAPVYHYCRERFGLEALKLWSA